jgi:alanyl-tRNA synthetase
MVSTLKLFYDSPALFEADARVAAVEGRSEAPVLVLDRTIFYPEGGGQPCDLGAIGAEAGAEAAVASVADERRDGKELVLHALAGPLAVAPGETVRLRVERGRRIDYQQQHTAEHLLGSIALRLLGARVVSVRFGPERSTIDFDLPAITEEGLAALEAAADAAIAEDHPIRYRLCPPEDASSFPLRRRPPEGEELLRIVEIEGLDFSPCCGLHLESTLGLRAIRVIGTEKYKGLTRLYFVAGGRASADYLALSRNAQAAARSLGSSEAGLAEAAAREAARRKELEFALVGMERERAKSEAAAAPEAALVALKNKDAAAAAPEAVRVELGNGAGAPLALRRYSDRSAASLMASAKAFAEAGMTALFASLPDLTAQALAPSSEAKLDERLKGPLAAAGGKGGGGPASFRATFADEASLERFMEDAEALLHGGN